MTGVFVCGIDSCLKPCDRVFDGCRNMNGEDCASVFFLTIY